MLGTIHLGRSFEERSNVETELWIAIGSLVLKVIVNKNNTLLYCDKSCPKKHLGDDMTWDLQGWAPCLRWAKIDGRMHTVSNWLLPAKAHVCIPSAENMARADALPQLFLREIFGLFCFIKFQCFMRIAGVNHRLVACNHLSFILMGEEGTQ